MERKHSLDSACSGFVKLPSRSAPAFSLILSTTVVMDLHEGPASWLLATSLWDRGVIFRRLMVSAHLLGQRNQVRSLLNLRLECRLEVHRLAALYVADMMGFLTGYACCVTELHAMQKWHRRRCASSRTAQPSH